jgi:hypothetical protein
MAKRYWRRYARRDERRLSVRKRIARFVRSLFSSGSDEPFDPPVGGVGVREPRRPLRPSMSGTAVLEAPPEEMRDVWAVGDEDNR